MLAAESNRPYFRLGRHRIGLDCGGETAFVSHAHSDHVSGARKTKTLLASWETLDLMHARGCAPKSAAVVSTVKHDSAKVELLNAGHILGSRQLYIENGSSFVFTGDFKLRDSLTQKGAEVRECDTLLMECTYGMPQFEFPSADTVAEEISSWVSGEFKRGNSVILGGYSLGKAQELVRLLNDYNGITPVVDSSVGKISEVYRRHGVPLRFVGENSAEGSGMLKRQFVAVYPYQKVNLPLAQSLSEFYGRGVSVGVASGWSLVGRTPQAHAAFCLSDHAGFSDLVEYVELARPSRVVCAFGYNRLFAKELRRRGFNAHPLEEISSQQAQALVEFA
ncbi:MAG: MBL fold metallo-hydrolase [Candidatus Micrarchaeota archaeon]